MCRVLRVGPARGPGGQAEAQRAFSRSMALSGLRCILTYVFLPVVAPALGLAAGAGPVLGILIGLVAIVANVFTVRRFWASDHRWRWSVTAVSGGVVAALVVLMVIDLARLTG